ncbi:fungal-specific transcription factor domain-containing protein, partial [Xylariaceae sp. FL0662B]
IIGTIQSETSPQQGVASLGWQPIPLTRRNLDAAEAKCAQLNRLLASLNPDLDIEAALRSVSSSYDGTPSIDEDAPDDVGEYDWHETLSRAATPKDGMAILSTVDAGYLGSSSGSDLLQEIASLLPQMAPGKASSPASPRSRGATASTSEVPRFDPPDLGASVIITKFIDSYFLFYNTCYPIVHEKTFRQRVEKRQQMSSVSRRIIYYMVLALGHWISTDKSSWDYYSAARSRVSVAMLESGSMETIEAFLLMSNYLQKRDRPNTGFIFSGIAYRMAIGLGLHREPPTAVNSMAKERRRQLFWILFCFDSGFNITTGRPPGMTQGFIDTHLPRNIDDRNGDAVLDEVNYPTTYSAIIAQAKLAQLADVIYAEFLLAKTANAKIEYQVAEMLDQRVEEWRTQLPEYFTSDDIPAWFLGPRSVVLWKAKNLQILLWRGTKRQHSYLPEKPDARSRCLEIAMRSIHEIATFCTTYEGILHLGISWYATYFLFQAVLVIEANYFNKEEYVGDDEKRAWQLCVSSARTCMELLARNSVAASRCLEILDRLHNHFVVPTNEPLLNFQMVVSAASSEPSLGSGLTPHEAYSDMMGQDFALNDFVPDPTLRMLVGQTPIDLFNNTPLDFLFDDSSIGTGYT